MKVQSLDLFPAHVKIFDFDEDPALNAGLLRAARERPEINDSASGVSTFRIAEPWVKSLRDRFDTALASYLEDTLPGRDAPVEVETYGFVNYAKKSSFTPVHNHLIEADVVAIYYVVVPEPPAERPESSYYAMDDGLLVLHDPRLDTRADRRSPFARDLYFPIQPRPNRMVVHPAWLAHSVTPNDGRERLAATCMFTINRRELFAGYDRYLLPRR